MKIHLRNSFSQRYLAVLVLAMITCRIETSLAQAAGKVTGQVQLPDGEMKRGLRVRAISKTPGVKSRTLELRTGDFNYTSRLYTFTIDRLRPGKYNIAVCDGLDYLPAVRIATVSAGPVPTTVDFLLEDQPKGTEKIVLPIKRPDGHLVEKNVPVFLKQVTTGCSLTEAATNDNGLAEFDGLPKGDYEVSLDEADLDR